MSDVQSKSQPRPPPSLNTGSALAAHQPQESKLTCPHCIIYCHASDVCAVSEWDNVLHCVAVHCVQAVGCAGKRHSLARAYVCMGDTLGDNF